MNINVVLDGVKKAGKVACDVAKSINWEKVIGMACTVIPAAMSVCKGIKELKADGKPATETNDIPDEATSGEPDAEYETPNEDTPDKEQ